MKDALKLTVEVTENDIEQGEKDHLRCCPVALAIRRSIPDDLDLVPEVCSVFLKTNVKAHLAYVNRPNGTYKTQEYYTTKLPDEVHDFLEAFDKGKNPDKPAKFDLIFEPIE